MATIRQALMLMLLSAAPRRVCPMCFMERANLNSGECRSQLRPLADSLEFGLRFGVCCVCGEERITLGIAQDEDVLA